MYLWLTDQICLLEVVFDPALSDHMLIYGIMKEKTKKHSGNIIQFSSYKNFDPVKEDEEEASKGQRLYVKMQSEQGERLLRGI